MAKTFVFLAALCVLIGCPRKTPSLSDEKVAAVYARARLISEHFKSAPDSAEKYIVALYKDQGVTAGILDTYIMEKQKNPEKWENTQRLIVEELKKLNPRKK